MRIEDEVKSVELKCKSGATSRKEETMSKRTKHKSADRTGSAYHVYQDFQKEGNQPM